MSSTRNEARRSPNPYFTTFSCISGIHFLRPTRIEMRSPTVEAAWRQASAGAVTAMSPDSSRAPRRNGS